MWFQRLKLQYDEPLSNFAFNFNLRRYNKAVQRHAALRKTDVQLDNAMDDAGSRFVDALVAAEGESSEEAINLIDSTDTASSAGGGGARAGAAAAAAGTAGVAAAAGAGTAGVVAAAAADGSSSSGGSSTEDDTAAAILAAR